MEKSRQTGHTAPIPAAEPDGKLRGYTALSTYMSTWSELGVVRRFGALHYRNLLYLQDEILEIEENLAKRDRIVGVEHGSRRRDQDSVRAGLMRQLREKLQLYDEALLSTSTVQQMRKAEKHQIRAVEAFIKAARPLVGEEEAFLDNQADLIAVNPPPEESVPIWIAALFMVSGLGCLIRSRTQTRLFEDQNFDIERFKVLIPSQARIKWIVRCFITLTGCFLLLVPILLLYFLQDRADAVKLSIVIATVLGFSVITSGLTNAKNWEVVASSIAYSAVLVVFISSGVGGSVSSAITPGGQR